MKLLVKTKRLFNNRVVGLFVFLILYSVGVTYAVPPLTRYQQGETLDPNCTPGSTNCTVDIFPDQTGQSGKYLTTDGTSVSWGTVSGGALSDGDKGDITVSGSGATWDIDILPSTDGASSTIFSGSGLESLSGGIALLQGCSDSQILKWNETTDTWACAADATGGGAGNSFETIATPAGTNPIADSSTDTLTFAVTGTNVTVTGSSAADSVTFDLVESVLAGNGLGTSSDALVVNTGNGIQLATDAVALGVLSANWDQTGAFDIVLNNAGSELRILESAGGAFFGTFDVADLAADRTYTFPDAAGTVITTGNISDITGLTDSQISNTLTASIFVGSGSTTNAVDLGTAEVSGTLAITNGGTGATSLADLITLGTHTTGSYVASFTAGGGLTGDASGEGSTPTLAVVSANGGIVVNANDIALTVPAAADGLSATTSSGSGLEILSGGIALLQGCSDSQILKWNETTDTWACAADNSSAVTDGDKGDIVVSGGGTTWDIDADVIDWADIADATTLDASTSISFGASTNSFTFTNNGSGDLITNLTSTGDFVIQDNGTPIASFLDTGAITFAPTSGQSITNTLTGAGTYTITSGVTTGTTTASALALNANALTSGTGLYVASSTLSSGSLANFVVSGTAAASNTQTVLTLATSGANGTATQTTYGLRATNTRTGTTSTNVALYASATGGTNNYAAIFENGRVGIGTATPTVVLDVRGTAGNTVVDVTNGTAVYFRVNAVADNVNAVGVQAGQGVTSQYGNFFGYRSGTSATNALGSNFFGFEAGVNATNAQRASFFGSGAGSNATNAEYSNFFGYLSGYGATSADNSNFFGQSSGFQSTGAAGSNFFGFEAGRDATSALRSNFFGYRAGAASTNASYSTLLGFQAGSFFTGNNIGSNNIVIGTNISLPDATANAINIGGILFGTGAYSTTTGTPSITPVSGGRIGIGDVTPAALFTVGNGDLFQINTSGRVLADVGASGAGNLAYSFVGDTDTGLYRSAADQIRIQTAGTDRITVTSTGSVGIATTGPDRVLDVLDASNPQLRLTTTDGSVFADLRNLGGSLLLLNGSSLTAASGVEYGLRVEPTINQTSTAGYTALLVNTTETGTGSGVRNLMDVQVGGTSRFRVQSGGQIFAGNLGTIGANQDALCIVNGGTEIQRNTGAQTCTVSSARFKHNITPIETSVLDQVLSLAPSTFVYNGQTNERIGLVAEQVALVEPRLVFYEEDGTTIRGVRYEDLSVLVLKAVQELAVKTQPLPPLTDQTFIARLQEFLKGVAERGEAIVDRVFAKEVKTEKLCVGDTTGEVCITKQDLQQLLQQQALPAQAPSPAPSQPEEVVPLEGDVTPPPADEPTVLDETL